MAGYGVLEEDLFIYLLLGYSCFTMLCYFLLYSKVEFPVLYIMFSLVIYFIHISVYMSITITQFIPPPSPPWCPYFCSVHLCLYFCLANRFICTIFLNWRKIFSEIGAVYRDKQFSDNEKLKREIKDAKQYST